PPTYSSGPFPASKTSAAATGPLMPLPGAPNAAQLDPFQRAAFGAETPPAVLKAPPANSAGPEPSTNPLSVWTSPSIPLPSADQVVPFQRAMCAAEAPPAVVKLPPAYNAGPEPSSKVVSAS